jgi:hypothetical protein
MKFHVTQRRNQMRKSLAMITLALTVSLPSMAMSAGSPATEPVDPPYIALFAPVTMVVVLGYSLTGQGAVLCEKMGGKWEPLANGNNCPGGRWAKFYGLI